MDFWEEFAMLQASAALHAAVRKYAGKYFSPDELVAANMVLDAFASLRERVQTPPSPSPSLTPNWSFQSYSGRVSGNAPVVAIR